LPAPHLTAAVVALDDTLGAASWAFEAANFAAGREASGCEKALNQNQN